MKFKQFRKQIPYDGEGNDLGETGETIGTGNDARLAFMNRINDQNDEARAEELLDINDDGETEPFVAQHADGTKEQLVDETVKDATADAEIDRLAQESGTEETQQQPQMITRKINGKDVTRSVDEWLAIASKVDAADVYLAEAARLRNEQLQKAQASTKVDPEPQQQVVDEDEADLALARAIQMGSEEEAKAAVRAIRKAQTPSITQDEIARTIDERLTFNEAISKFRSDFRDIVEDPVLNQMALDMDRKLVAQKDARPYEERYKAIGTSIRKWADEMAKKRNPTPATAPGADKLARKAAATPVPKAASQKTASTVDEEPEESPSSVISKMAQARGGPQWMQGPATRQ